MNILDKIKSKKSLKNLDDEIVEKYLPSRIPQNEKSKQYKKIVKNVRTKLHKIYGVFWLDEKFTLDSHKSTKERKKIYPGLYKELFVIKPKTILDLACGLNYLSLKDYDLRYIGIEFSQLDCDRINNHMKKIKFKGKIIKKDLTKDFNLPKSDICLMFKTLDTLETKGHKLAEKLIVSIKSKYIIASFPTKTVSGKKMNHPYRGWIERMCERLNYEYKIIFKQNEIFYVIKK